MWKSREEEDDMLGGANSSCVSAVSEAFCQVSIFLDPPNNPGDIISGRKSFTASEGLTS